jgi:hypothetical protein
MTVFFSLRNMKGMIAQFPYYFNVNHKKQGMTFFKYLSLFSGRPTPFRGSK